MSPFQTLEDSGVTLSLAVAAVVTPPDGGIDANASDSDVVVV
jgi:hypothetical protein